MDNYTKEKGIAIIGMGCIFPKANDLHEYWDNIQNKISCIEQVPKHRWDYNFYYNPDRNADDKTYSIIGGFTEDPDTRSLIKKFKIPPKVIDAMDRAQKNALLATANALEDSGYNVRNFDRSRCAVIIGNSLGGDQKDITNLRILMIKIKDCLKKSAPFSRLASALQEQILEEFDFSYQNRLPKITEDTMPGELSNIISGRIANTLNLNGPNFVIDASYASSMASLNTAVRGLRAHDFDIAIAGGSDYMMGPAPYIKFCRIRALSENGSFPFDARANGFVMGEGTGIFILKRLPDAVRDGDKIYAVIKGIGSSSFGNGNDITKLSKDGQTMAIERAFHDTGYSPDTVQYVEAYGSATVEGDTEEMKALLKIWGNCVNKNSIGLGSVKSNIGNLKAASAASSIIKVALALYNRILPPTINFEKPNPNINFRDIPFRIIQEAEEWPRGKNGVPRRANVSSFGMGWTNFHVAMEEYIDSDSPHIYRDYYRDNTLHFSVKEKQPAIV